MAKRQFQLNEVEIRPLREREQQTKSVTELKRLQAVRLYGTGTGMETIVDITGCAESSIREWIQDYKRDGLAGLGSHYERSAQNARKLTDEQRDDLRARLNHYRPDQVLSPTMRISHGVFWTVSDLYIALEQWYGVVYEDPGTYRALFHRCGFSYQRAERVYKSHPSEVEVADFEAELEKK